VTGIPRDGVGLWRPVHNGTVLTSPPRSAGWLHADPDSSEFSTAWRPPPGVHSIGRSDYQTIHACLTHSISHWTTTSDHAGSGSGTNRRREPSQF